MAIPFELYTDGGRMRFPEHFPVGEHIIESWPHEDWPHEDRVHGAGSGPASRGVGLLPLPGADQSIAVKWRGYHHPEDGSLHFVAMFTFAGECLQVKERYEYIHVDGRGTFRQRFRTRGDKACCTELVRALTSGEDLPVEPIERGAYRGMWRCDVHVSRSRPRPGIHLEELACRTVINTDKKSLLLFRWRYVECA